MSLWFFWSSELQSVSSVSWGHGITNVWVLQCFLGPFVYLIAPTFQHPGRTSDRPRINVPDISTGVLLKLFFTNDTATWMDFWTMTLVIQHLMFAGYNLYKVTTLTGWMGSSYQHQFTSCGCQQICENTSEQLIFHLYGPLKILLFSLAIYRNGALYHRPFTDTIKSWQ